MRRFLKKISNSEFIRNVGKLSSATIAGQVITIITAPLLYRIYNQTSYGTLGLYIAITGVVGVFSSLQFLQTILIEKEDEKALTALWLNRVLNIFFAAFLFLVVLISHQWLIVALKNEQIGRWLWLIPASVFFAGQNEILRVWANRKKEYNILMLNALLTSIIVPIVSISLGLISSGNDMGLFLGLFASQFCPALILFFSLRKKHGFGSFSYHIPRLKKFAVENRQFPLYSVPSEFVNRFTNQLPVFMLNQYFGSSTVGVYNLAVRMLGLPIQFVGNAISTVFQQKASHDYNFTGSCRSVFVKTLRTLSLISIVPTVVILLAGPWLFGFVFGAEWFQSGEFAQVLIILFVGKLIVSPLSYMFYVTKRLKEDLIWHIWMLVSNAILFPLLIHLGYQVKTILLIYAMNYLVIYGIYLIRSYQFTDHETE